MAGLSLSTPGLSLTGKLSIPPGLSLNSSTTAFPGGGLSGGGSTAPVYTNLITNFDFANVYWAKTGLTTPSAIQIKETATTEAHFTQAASATGFPLTGIHNYTASVDVTPGGGGRYFALGLNSFGSESMVVQCDLTAAGTILGVTGGGWPGSTSSITLVSSNVWRIAAGFTTLAGTTGLNFFLYMLGGLNVFSYAGSAINSMTITNITFYQTS